VSTPSPGQSLHVLLIADRFPPRPGGRASLLHELARHLPGERTSVSTRGARGGAGIDRGVPARIHRAPNSFFGSQRLAAAMWRRQLRRISADAGSGIVVASGGPTEGYLAQRLFRELGVPYVLHFETPELTDLRERIRIGGPTGVGLEGLVEDAAGIVVGGPTCRLAAYKLGVYPHRIDVVLPGVDTERFRPGEKPAALLKKLGSPRGPLLLTVVGESTAHDLPTLFRALASLRHQRRGAQLVVVGATADGHGELLAEVGVTNAVHFVPRVPPAEMPDWYRVADVFVIAHRNDRTPDAVAGIPVALIEAMASGLPIVGTKSPAIDEIARSDEEAVLVEPEAHAKLAKSVLALARSGEMSEALATRARERAQSTFEASRYGREFRELLEVLYFRRLGLGTIETPPAPSVQEASPAA
jgi:phosphatidylinositol alpha-1,6-mannosyltransferase